MMKWQSFIRRANQMKTILADEQGASLVKYGLTFALVAEASLFALSLFNGGAPETLAHIARFMTTAV